MVSFIQFGGDRLVQRLNKRWQRFSLPMQSSGASRIRAGEVCHGGNMLRSCEIDRCCTDRVVSQADLLPNLIKQAGLSSSLMRSSKS